MFSAFLPLAALISLTLAVDCLGGQGKNPNTDVAWHLRDQICGHNACAASDADRGTNHYCQLSIPYQPGKEVTMQRNDPKGKFPNCYEGFADIIKQCFSDATSSFTGTDPSGRWLSGNEWYWVTFNDTVGTIGEDRWEDDFLIKNGQVQGETQEGPSQFCQGLSPGGGESCITIPAGCRIQDPGYNAVPNIDCSPIPNDA